MKIIIENKDGEQYELGGFDRDLVVRINLEKSESKSLTVDIDKDVHQRLKRLSVESEIPMRYIVNALLKSYFDGK